MTATSNRPVHTQPWLHQRGHEVQAFGTVRQFPIGLSAEARLYSCQRLNRILADSQILYAQYKKHHWLMRGPTFYALHLLLDKHASEQLVIIDSLAERVQSLGGVAVGDPRHVAEITRIPRSPDGVEEVPAMLSRLLEAHEEILTDAHDCQPRGYPKARFVARCHRRQIVAHGTGNAPAIQDARRHGSSPIR